MLNLNYRFITTDETKSIEITESQKNYFMITLIIFLYNFLLFQCRKYFLLKSKFVMLLFQISKIN